ncbi:MAG: hypothetical protein IIU10_03660, partial [Paludibacteraceae bacterium]|nr:hypothetical protein [Paludibacteraceae bacterium]
FNVTSEYLEIVTYYLDENDNPLVFNTIRVKNSRPSAAQGLENAKEEENNTIQSGKFLRNGQLYVLKNGITYTILGQKIAQ